MGGALPGEGPVEFTTATTVAAFAKPQAAQGAAERASTECSGRRCSAPPAAGCRLAGVAVVNSPPAGR